MRIRRRREDDLDACADLARAVLATDGYPARPAPDLGRFIVSPGAIQAWVAEDDGALVGHIALHPNGSPEVMALAAQATGQAPDRLLVVARLLVAGTHRRRGIGRALLTEATHAAHARGMWPILDVATHFSGAVDLYERAGWRCAGTVLVPITGHEPLDEFVYIGPPPPGT